MIYKIIVICLSFSSTVIHLAKHGEKRKGKYNFFISLMSFFICMYLYYKCGLFDFIQHT